MKEIKSEQVKEVKDYVKNILKNQMSNDLIHHNWDATKENRAILIDIADNLDVPEYDKNVALVANYFLYTGFVESDHKFYKGAGIVAERFMNQNGYHPTVIADVLGCIAVKSEQKEPETLSERIFSDMAFAYYGQSKLKKRIKRTWDERNFIKDDKIDYVTTLEKKYEEMNNHTFHTPYAKRSYKYKKNQNLDKLKSSIDKERSKNNLSNNKTAMTMFKTALRNHIDLINIADKKAGIMISINAILMTVMIPILGSYIIDVSKFIIPSVILIFTCGAAVILATMATRPQVSDGKISDDDIVKGEKSIFHFANFFQMNKGEYQSAIKDVIVRDITLENSIINDLYDMGVILGIKYKRLRWCYFIFAIGIGLTLISFILSFFIFPEI